MSFLGGFLEISFDYSCFLVYYCVIFVCFFIYIFYRGVYIYFREKFILVNIVSVFYFENSLENKIVVLILGESNFYMKLIIILIFSEEFV